MVFCVQHADAADEIVDCLVQAICIPGLPFDPTKVARLYLLSDILYNASASVPNAWKYRILFQSQLITVFQHLADLWKTIPGRLKAEQFRVQAFDLIELWESWNVFRLDHVQKWKMLFTLHTPDNPSVETEIHVPVVDTATTISDKVVPFVEVSDKFVPLTEVESLAPLTAVESVPSTQLLPQGTDLDKAPSRALSRVIPLKSKPIKFKLGLSNTTKVLLKPTLSAPTPVIIPDLDEKHILLQDKNPTIRPKTPEPTIDPDQEELDGQDASQLDIEIDGQPLKATEYSQMLIEKDLQECVDLYFKEAIEQHCLPVQDVDGVPVSLPLQESRSGPPKTKFKSNKKSKLHQKIPLPPDDPDYDMFS